MEHRLKLEQIKKLITNTPLIKISYTIDNSDKKYIFAKCEWFSLTGSIKDKVAYQILKTAYEQGNISTGDKIVEVSSGNMGLSLTAVANLLGNPTTIIMPKTMSEERKQLIRLYGATLIETDDFISAFALRDKLVTSGEYFCTEQFKNPNNTVAHQEMTAQEILKYSEQISPAETFVAGIGTSGTLSGIGIELKKHLGLKITAIEFETRLVLSTFSGIVPLDKIPPPAYIVEITIRAVMVRTINVSINTPIIAATPCSWGSLTSASA